jgi:hypothetical protein
VLGAQKVASTTPVTEETAASEPELVLPVTGRDELLRQHEAVRRVADFAPSEFRHWIAREKRTVAGIAWINCVGNLATIRDRTHSMTLALLALSATALFT